MAKTCKSSANSKSNRTATMERRKGEDRRKQQTPVAAERRKVQRRRQIDPTTCERDYSGEEIEFMQAMDEYKRRSGRMFPTCSEILEVIRELGYVRRTPSDNDGLQHGGDHPILTGDAGETPSNLTADAEGFAAE